MDTEFTIALETKPDMGFYSKQRKIALLVYGIFEQLFVSGAIYGWVALVFVLKEEGYFSQLCDDVDKPINGTTPTKILNCAIQNEQLNLVYTIAVVLSGVVIVLVGVLIDKHGPRAARHIGSLLLATSGIFWFFSTTAQSILLFPAVLSLALTGVFWTATWMQVGALVYQDHQSTVICLLSAAFDASAVMLLMIKILHEYQNLLTINELMCAYCGIGTITSIIATFTIIPSRKSVQEDLDEQILQKGIERVRQMSIRSFCGAFDDILPATLSPIEEEGETDGGTSSQLMLNGELHNGNLLHPNAAIHPKEKEAHRGAAMGLEAGELEYLERTMEKGRKSEFLGLARSSSYLWHVAMSSLVILRINFFVSSFDALISWLSNGNEFVLDQYTNAFGMFQFFGALFAPIMGPYLDGKLCMKGEGMDMKRAKLLRCAIALGITNTISLILAVGVVTPVLEVQYMAMLCQVILRGFFFAVHFSYIAEAFPSKHYGKLSCLALLLAVLVGSLQYPFFIAIERSLNGNPFWINIGLLIVTIILYGQPINIRRSLRDK